MTHQSHVGRFTLRSYGQLVGDGRYSACFGVTEHTGDAELDHKQTTGQIFNTEAEAEDAGMQAALAWMDDREED